MTHWVRRNNFWILMGTIWAIALCLTIFSLFQSDEEVRPMQTDRPICCSTPGLQPVN